MVSALGRKVWGKAQISRHTG